MEDNDKNTKEIASLFLAKKIISVQNIGKSSEIELEERIKAIDDLFVFMEDRKLDNNEVKEKLDKLVRRIYYSEMRRLEENFNSEIPIFIGDAAKGDSLGVYVDNKYISINTNLLYEDLKEPDYDTRMKGCERIVRTIAHEIQHHRQFIMATRAVSSKEALIFGKDFAICEILGKEYYEYNYNEIGMENDADKIAEKKEMEARGYDRKAEINRLEYEIMERTAEYEVMDVKTSDGQKYDIVSQDKEKIMDEVLDREITINKKTNILNSYPILQKVYNMDGTKKGIQQLIDEKEKEKEEMLNNEFLSDEEERHAIEDSEDMYLDLIYKSLPKTTEADLNKIGKTKLNEILNKIESKFENEAEELINIGEDCKNLKNEEVDEGQKRIFFIQKFFKKRINEIQFLRIKNKAHHKLKNQKKVIKQARKGKVPREPINVQTQALKVIRPIDKMEIRLRKFISKMNDGMNRVLKPKKYEVSESKINNKETGIAKNLKIDSNENNEERNNRKNEFYQRIRVENKNLKINENDKELIEEDKNINTREREER